MSGKHCHCEEGLPEWIMSYADMITILMAFFVVMYSMAGNKDSAREQAVLQSLRDQFSPMVYGWGALLPARQSRKNNSAFDLPFQGGTKEKNKNQGGAESRAQPPGEFARVHSPRPGEQTRVGGVIYFSGDGDGLSEPQERSLKVIAEELQGKPQKIEIRGHTARRQIGRNVSEKDAWDLAYARCRSTMEYLVSLGIAPERIRLGVAGDNEPLGEAGASSSPGHTSRVEVFLLSEVAEATTQNSKALRPNRPLDPTQQPES